MGFFHKKINDFQLVEDFAGKHTTLLGCFGLKLTS
tara:strand:+ start:93 stop:197 length:105 start_codon:yes stop_codon:yes gene_type:complete